MSQFEFISRLRRSLAGLPEEEIERAVEYYEDYFSDAGEGGEEHIIEKLGNPEDIAEIIRKNLESPERAGFTEHGYEDIPDPKTGAITPVTSLEKSERKGQQEQSTYSGNGNTGNGTYTGGNYNSQDYGNKYNHTYGGDYSDLGSQPRRKSNHGCLIWFLITFAIFIILIIVAIIAAVTFGLKVAHDVGKTSMESVMEAVSDEITEELDEDFAEEVTDNVHQAEHDEEYRKQKHGKKNGGEKILDDSEQELETGIIYTPAQGVPAGIDIDIQAGTIKIEKGDDFSVCVTKKYSNINIVSSCTKDGIWKITGDITGDAEDAIDFIKGFLKKNAVAIIVITIPSDYKAQSYELKVDAGNVKAEYVQAEKAQICLNAGSCNIDKMCVDKAELEIDAGNVKVEEFRASSSTFKINAGSLKIEDGDASDAQFHCDMGTIKYKGILKGSNNIGCAMGNVTLDLDDDLSNYTVLAKASMGTVKINGEKYSGMNNQVKQGDGDTKIDVNADMGNVKIKTK